MGTPKTSDGKPIFLPNLFPGNVVLYYAGAGDHATNGRGNGALFQVESNVQEDKTLEWQFNDWVYLSGATFSWQGGDIGDHASMDLYCPATPVTAAQGNGNCNVVNGVIVPAAGNGGYNVDLTLANPVPAFAPAGEEDTPTAIGYWEWDDPNTGRGTITPGTPGASPWFLIAADVPLTRFAARFPILGSDSSQAQVPAIKPKKILPHWRFKFTLHNSSAKNVKIAWHLITARVSTT